MSDPVARLEELSGNALWLVGGAVRDRLLGRPTTDYDVVIDGDPRRLARALARAAGGHPFELSDAFGAWRVVARDRSWQVDVTRLAGATIEDDLRQRDLTINAIAQPLQDGDRHIDPVGGIDDLRAHRLRTVSPDSFERDPLRTMRLVRLACELDFVIDADTGRAAAQSVSALAGVAPERVFTELRLILSSERALEGIRLLDRLGVTNTVLPELARLRGIEQSRYHHLDVHDHTQAVLAEVIALQRDLQPVFGEHAPRLAAILAEPLANELSRGQALRFGALFHDIAKPSTRAVTPEGRVTFIGHDAAGAEMTIAVLQRLRASERLSRYVAALTRHHLRLGFLVHEVPLSRRSVYRYLKACAPVQVDVTVLSVADRLATRGSGSAAAIEKHVELARQLIGEALAWRDAPPRPPVRGDELTRASGTNPGPAIGRVLAELEEASFAGEIASRAEALQRGRELLGELRRSNGDR